MILVSTTLPEHIANLEAKHGGLRIAARALGIDAGYLSRLAQGKKTAPSKAVLRKLGLEVTVNYWRKGKP